MFITVARTVSHLCDCLRKQGLQNPRNRGSPSSVGLSYCSSWVWPVMIPQAGWLYWQHPLYHHVTRQTRSLQGHGPCRSVPRHLKSPVPFSLQSVLSFFFLLCKVAYVYLWLIHLDLWQKTIFCKAINLQLKINKFLKVKNNPQVFTRFSAHSVSGQRNLFKTTAWPLRLLRWRPSKERVCPCRQTQKMWVQPLDQEDPLEEGTATYSSVLAWRIPWAEEPGGLQSMGRRESDMTQ